MDGGIPEAKQSRTPLIAGVAIAVAAALGAGYWLGRSPPPPPAPPAAPAAPPAAAAPATPPPPVAEERLRALLESVSANPLFHKWLAEPDPLHRWAVVADNLAEGVTPRAQLGFLRPERSFSTVESHGRTVAAPQAYARYDAIADAVASVDAQALAKVVRELHPVLEWTYRQLGYPAASLDAVAAQGLSRLEAAPVPADAPELRLKGAIWPYADPKLEELGPVEKHLLRMGPRNARLVQQKARELRAALGLPAVATPGRAR